MEYTDTPPAESTSRQPSSPSMERSETAEGKASDMVAVMLSIRAGPRPYL